MKCKQYQNLIMQYFDHELDKEEKDLLDQHIGSCSSCRALFDKLNGILNVLEQSQQIEVDPELERSVFARIKSLPAYSVKNKYSPSINLGRAIAAAALLAILLPMLSLKSSLIDLIFDAVGYADSILKHIWNVQIIYDISSGLFQETLNSLFQTIQCVCIAGVICTAIICLKNAIDRSGRIQKSKMVQ
jgi:hypothetical protein